MNVWPHPQQLALLNDYYVINPNQFNFVTKTKGKCELLDKAINRYKSNTFLRDCSRLNGIQPKISNEKYQINGVNQLMNLTITINQKCEQHPYINMNEMYRLSVENNQANIFTESIWGALWGLETFSQLVNQIGVNLFAINKTLIIDYPRFTHRGVMLDSSRHYIPLKVIYENLDAMAYNKFNVFHWHIVDDQSFPYVSKKFPELSLKGAFNPKTHIYTVKQINQVIEYARERGIRVLVEFDTPGHTQSWGKGQPGLLTQCYNGGTPNGKYGPIDPTKDESYTFVEQLFGEVSTVFPDKYFHVGGDEVDFKCWLSNPNVTSFMKKKHLSDGSKLEEYYIKNILDIVTKLNKSYIVWQEVFDNNVTIKQDTVVHVWKGNWDYEMSKVTQANYHAILSSCWYLNNIVYGTIWPTYYKCDPQNFNGTDAQNKLVLGGEACMWGEWVDGSNLMSRTWLVIKSCFNKLITN